MIELAENCPKVLRSQLEPLVQLCLKVMDDADVENAQRHLALEILVSLCETAPAMVRKQSQLLKPVIHQVLQLMVDLDDDDQWALQDEDEDEDRYVQSSPRPRLRAQMRRPKFVCDSLLSLGHLLAEICR